MNVYVLPAPARTLNAVRCVINSRARVRGLTERKRLHAFGVALHALEDGASSAWATQAAIQDMREARQLAPVGGTAA